MYGNGNVWGIWWLHNRDMRISSKWSSTSCQCPSYSLSLSSSLLDATSSLAPTVSPFIIHWHWQMITLLVSQSTFKEHSKNTQRTLAWGGRGVIFDPPKKLLYSFVLKSQNEKYLVMNFPQKLQHILQDKESTAIQGFSRNASNLERTGFPN